MANRRGRIAGWMVTILLLSAYSGVAQSGQSFRARLSTVPVDATMLATVTGSGSLKAVLTGTKLTITGTFQGLRSPATRASLHVGSQKGIPGPAMHDLTVTNNKSGSVSGSIELAASEVEDLKDGRIYVQIDSQGAPDGNLWGWLLR